MTEPGPTILWFRQDLRLQDNPALLAAAGRGAPVLPVFVLDDINAAEWAPGAASRWWLHHSLENLNRSIGGHLMVLSGKADEVLPALATKVKANGVVWNRCYEPWRIARDASLERILTASGFEATSYNGSLLFEPHTVCKSDGTPYKVFTPFYRKGCISAPPPRLPVSGPVNVSWYKQDRPTEISELELLPKIRWYQGLAADWVPGEEGAHDRLEKFLGEGLDNYKEGRNFPAAPFVSRLSPHLHFGELSPHQVWAAAGELDGDQAIIADIEHFKSELAWREFSYHLLFHFPTLVRDNLQMKFDRFPWREDPVGLKKWQQGRTGFPIVDAGMRELWQTGYMHNRVRMIVASFLVKNLLLHWHLGEDWFWDTLVDADLANNSCSWQWVAGCGADAAPYFRIFNPVTQSQKFDPDGEYIRRFVPELSALPAKLIHRPWEATETALSHAGLRLGKEYPSPMVNLKDTRERALAAFRALRAQEVSPRRP